MLIGIFGAPSVLFIDAATYVVSFVLVQAFVPQRKPLPVEDRTRGVLAGLRFLASEPLLRVWIPLFIAGDAAWQAFFAAVPVLVVESYDAHATVAGILFAGFGAGCIVGNIASFRFLTDRIDGLRLVALSVPFQALPLWILPLHVGAPVLVAAIFASGIANGICNPTIHATMTLRMPPAIRAKAMTANMTLWGLGMPLGLIIAGPVLSTYGARPVLVGFAFVQTVAMFGVARRVAACTLVRAPASARVIFRNRSLLALLAAELVSRGGSQMTFLALPWFVLVTTGSPAKMGIVLAVELLPTALLGIPSGTLVTRIGARLTMLVADLARVPLMAALPILHSAGMLSFPLLLVLVAAFGCFNAPYFASQRVILPELLGNDEQTIAQANSVLEGAGQTSSLLGPPLAGLLIATLGAANVLYVDAATFAFSFLTVLLFVPARKRAAAAEDSGGLLAGMSFLLRDALMGPLVTVIILMNALGQMLGAALPVLAFQRYDDARVGGWLFAAYGLGGVIGTVVAYKLVTRVPALTLASFAAIGFALPLWVLVPHVALVPILGALAFTALCQPLLNAPMFGVITTRTPSALLPKVMTAIITLATIAGPVGVLVAGALLEREGLMVTFGVIAGGVTIVALLFVGILTRFRRRELAAAAVSATP